MAIQQVYLLKYAEATGALVEIGFLSNEKEKELLKSTSYQKKMAASIYEGILKYATIQVDNP
ncbi:germination-specific N-acetylmuramoyl-L-alanine amidase [Gracilibacillus boraciitolerans JCM 21714]|uniref:Germination-specific N-acetylmuramoyl-L-alanine amidase n=1 Tax=Gracilibacillus boraciitolerans JCM 21714 TaxID=1298598 RepID=W4VLI3_9BACI|nr:germination-specific N-acetylmuramoyl-L-alanine amidase [Gracilibacillus boraciitolerans JCM 21714]